MLSDVAVGNNCGWILRVIDVVSRTWYFIMLWCYHVNCFCHRPMDDIVGLSSLVEFQLFLKTLKLKFETSRYKILILRSATLEIELLLDMIDQGLMGSYYSIILCSNKIKGKHTCTTSHWKFTKLQSKFTIWKILEQCNVALNTELWATFVAWPLKCKQFTRH